MKIKNKMDLVLAIGLLSHLENKANKHLLISAIKISSTNFTDEIIDGILEGKIKCFREGQSVMVGWDEPDGERTLLSCCNWLQHVKENRAHADILRQALGLANVSFDKREVLKLLIPKQKKGG